MLIEFTFARWLEAASFDELHPWTERLVEAFERDWGVTQVRYYASRTDEERATSDEFEFFAPDRATALERASALMQRVRAEPGCRLVPGFGCEVGAAGSWNVAIRLTRLPRVELTGHRGWVLREPSTAWRAYVEPLLDAGLFDHAVHAGVGFGLGAPESLYLAHKLSNLRALHAALSRELAEVGARSLTSGLRALARDVLRARFGPRLELATRAAWTAFAAQADEALEAAWGEALCATHLAPLGLTPRDWWKAGRARGWLAWLTA